MAGSSPPPARKRWELLEQRLRKEERGTSIETKFRQLAALMASVDSFGWREALAQDDERVRQLWTELRKKSSLG